MVSVVGGPVVCVGIAAGSEDSALLRGKGNSRAGGIGRIFARGPPSSEGSVVDEGFSIVVGVESTRGIEVSAVRVGAHAMCLFHAQTRKSLSESRISSQEQQVKT